MSTPALVDLLLEIRDEIEQELVRRSFERNSSTIDEWVRDGKKKQDP